MMFNHKTIYTYCIAIVSYIYDVIFPEDAHTKHVKQLTKQDIVNLPKASVIPGPYEALFSYADTQVRELIWQIKYFENTYLTNMIADSMLEHIIAIGTENIHHRPLVLIPIPLSPHRQKERGFNQTIQLAETIVQKAHDIFPITLDTTLLRKVRETLPQTHCDRKTRLTNITGAFHAITTRDLSHMHIIVIDDVITTGATMKESVRALKKAGARTITCLAIAH